MFFFSLFHQVQNTYDKGEKNENLYINFSFLFTVDSINPHIFFYLIPIFFYFRTATHSKKSLDNKPTSKYHFIILPRYSGTGDQVVKCF